MMPNWNWYTLGEPVDWLQAQRERAGATLGEGFAETVLVARRFLLR